MNYRKILLQCAFLLAGILYVLVFIGYSYWINLFRSSFNLISISAILFPLALFLLFRWFLWKHGKQITGKKTFVLFTILGVALPIYCFILLGINEFQNHFSTEKWIKSPEERVYIVDDLLNDYELKGKTKEEVTNLLGEPTPNAYFKGPNNIVYHLGIERSIIGIDSEWLVIWFNHSGKVAKYEILTD